MDTLQSKSPQTAAIRSFVFPGGGQYYNGQPIKGAVLSTLGVASAVLYMDFSEKYKNSEGVSQSDKKIFFIKETDMVGGSSLSIFMAY